MKALKIALVFTLCLLTFSSCFYTKWNRLSAEDKTWMDSYNLGDTVIFASENGVDTLAVTSKRIIDPLFPVRTNEGQSSTFNGSAGYDLTIVHKKKEYKGYMTIIKKCHHEEGVLTLSLRLHYRQYLTNNVGKLRFSKKIVVGTKFEDIISVGSQNTELYVNTEDTPASFLWSKSKGLIQYQYPNGEVYTLSSIKKAAAPEPTIRERIIDLLRR